MTGVAAVKVCAFDAYGTLFDFNTVHRCAEQLGDKAGALRDLWRNKQLQYFWVRNMLGEYRDYESITADALDIALKTLGLEHKAGLRERLIGLYDDFQPYTEVPQALRDLKAMGLRLVIHSNATPGLLQAIVRSCGFEGLFNDLVSIEDIGIYKPHPAAYQFLVDRLGVQRGEICFVSSNGWDTHGAAHFGFKVAWINRFGLPDDALPGKADFEIPTLSELIALLSH